MTTLQDVIDYVTEKAKLYGIQEVLVADSNFDKFIPEGMTFVIPKNAIAMDMTNVKYDWDSKEEDGVSTFKMSGHRLLFLLPDLVFRIEDGKIDCMGSPIDKPLPGVSYHHWPRMNDVYERWFGKPNSGQEFSGLAHLINTQ